MSTSSPTKPRRASSMLCHFISGRRGKCGIETTIYAESSITPSEPMTNNTQVIDGSDIASLVVLPTIGVFSVIGNSLLIYLVVSTPNKRDFVNYFVFSLALVDMITAVCIIPLQCLQIAGVFSAEDYACVLVVFFILTVALASVYSLLAVTFERHLAIARPLRRISIRNVRRLVLGTLVFIWGYSAGIAALLLIPGITAPPSYRHGKNCGMNQLVDNQGYSFFILCNFVIPIPIMVILYGHIFIIAKRQLRSVIGQVHPRPSNTSTVRMRIIKRELKTAMILFFITAYYILSWLVVFALVAVFQVKLQDNLHIITTMEILIYVNAALNPWIYAWANKALRKHLIQLFSGRRDDPRRHLSAATRPSFASISSSVSWSRRRDTEISQPSSDRYLY